jgi:acetolactate synthase I/II/III large subunit
MAVRPSAQQSDQAERAPIAAEIFLRSLAEHGVDYFFANPGTDFPPIVEAFVRAKNSNAKVPQPVLVPHENLAIAMAHGAYLMTGRPQAVMVHVNVGTANTINNIANLARDRAPIILAAGRTPITEKGSFGSRSRPIHWAQEMFDQAGMLREFVKWDYELRLPEQIGDVIARAYEMTMTSPRGPVYLVLPREPLSASLPEFPAASKPRALPAPAYPDPRAIAKLAEWIAAAERPLIIAGACGEPGAVQALGKLAQNWAIPVVCHNPRVLAFPSSHPMHFGFESGALLDDIDFALVIESDAPWYPSVKEPPETARIAHIGEDPLFARYPMRSFRSDLAIAADPGASLEALNAALAARFAGVQPRIEARRSLLAPRAKLRRAKFVKESEAAGDHITPQHLSRAIGEAVGADAIIFNEYPLQLDHCPREIPGTFFGLSPAGGLGWGLGAALGAKLAAPHRLVVAAIGDGAYLFSNPTVCHWVGETYRLPILTVIFNNSRYGAVRRATLSMFQDGAAGKDDGNFLADLTPSPAYHELARMQGCFAERVERPSELAGALARARDAVAKERRQALLHVVCPY